VVNLDIPVVEKPEEVHWVDNIHPGPKGASESPADQPVERSTRQHTQDLRCGANARHAREDALHELPVIVIFRRGAGIAHDDQVVVQVARGVGGARHADIGRAARDHQRIDIAVAQRQSR